MALVFADRVEDTSTTTGTTDFALSGTAPAGFQAWSVIGNTNTAYYTATDGSGNWETGIGTYSSTGPTLARTTVLASSNAGSKVSFPAGTKTVFNDPAAAYFIIYATGIAAWLASPTSANLATAMTDETGSGALVFAASPALTGSPTAPTQTAADNSTKIATTAFVQTAVAAVPAGPTVVLKTSQQTSSSATLANDNALFFTVSANTDYVFYFFIPVTNSATTAGGAQFAVTTPSGTIAYGVIVQDSSGGNSAGSTATSGTGFGLTGTIGSTMVGIVTGSVQVGATGGTLHLQFAQNTSVVSHAVTFKVGAYGTLTPSP